MSRRGQMTLFELELLRAILALVDQHFTNQQEKLTMSLVTTNDNAVRLRPTGVDRDGVTVVPGNLQLTVDKPDVASLAPDAANPGAYLLTPLPATDPSVGSRTVVVTTLDPTTNVSVQTSVEFDPGIESSLAVGTEIVPEAAKATA